MGSPNGRIVRSGNTKLSACRKLNVDGSSPRKGSKEKLKYKEKLETQTMNFVIIV